MATISKTWSARIRVGTEAQDITVVGKTEAEARRSAERNGSIINISEVKVSKLSLGMKRQDRFVFLMRMATMIGSRLPVTDSLRLMIDSFSGKISEAARSALPLVEAGVPLGEALARDVKNFPGSIGLLIRTGSAGGNTPNALREAAEFERLIGEASKGAMFAIIRSYAYMFVALALLAVNQYKVVPEMFNSSIMRMAENADFSFWQNIGWYFLVFQAAAIGFLTILVVLGTIGRRMAPDKVDALILKIPIMRDIVISQDNFIGLYRMALLVEAGVPLTETINSCYESSRPGALKEDFKRAAYALTRGDKWAKYMKTLHPTDRAALMLMPDNDELAKNLNYMAEQSKSLYLERLKVVSPILDVISALMMSVAGFIILIVTTIPQLQLVSEIMG